MRVQFKDNEDGSTDVYYASRCKKLGATPYKVATIKDRTFKRLPCSEWPWQAGRKLSYIQTLAGYRALVAGRIGPVTTVSHPIRWEIK